MADQPRWDLVDLEGGRSWEVRRAGGRGAALSRDLFGTISVGEFGYTVHDRAGVRYGPFSTLDDAAYGLAAREEQGDPLLLGDPIPEAPAPGAPARGALPASGSGASAPSSTESDRLTMELVVAACGAVIGVVLVLGIAAALGGRRRA